MAPATEDGRLDGRAEGKAAFILDLLEEKGTVSDDLRQKILSMTDMDVLKGWLMLAAKSASVVEFMQGMTDKAELCG